MTLNVNDDGDGTNAYSVCLSMKLIGEYYIIFRIKVEQHTEGNVSGANDCCVGLEPGDSFGSLPHEHLTGLPKISLP